MRCVIGQRRQCCHWLNGLTLRSDDRFMSETITHVRDIFTHLDALITTAVDDHVENVDSYREQG